MIRRQREDDGKAVTATLRFLGDGGFSVAMWPAAMTSPA
jgi:hypothetical protein